MIYTSILVARLKAPFQHARGARSVAYVPYSRGVSGLS